MPEKGEACRNCCLHVCLPGCLVTWLPSYLILCLSDLPGHLIRGDLSGAEVLIEETNLPPSGPEAEEGKDVNF